MGGGTRGVGEGTQRWARSAWEHPRVGEGTGRDRGCPSRGGPRGGRQGRAAGLEELECPVLGRNPPPKPSSGRLSGGRWGYKDILATKKPSLSSAASPVATSRHRQP